MADLDALREELNTLDQKLIELAARRQAIVREIGRAKQGMGRGTRDYAREKVVLGRARAAAAALDLDPDTAEALLTTLIRASLTTQEQDRVTATGSGDGRRVLVIGGNGKMGSWFVRFLDSQGFQVEVADPTGGPAGFPHYADWTPLTLDHDLVIVAAPLRASAKILEQLATQRPTGVVFDVGSLKSPLKRPLLALRDAGVQVCSVHPMFGPDTDLLSGKHVIFCDVGCASATQFARELFDATMASLVDMSLDEHDRTIAFVLGLSHALNIAFFTALSESNQDVPRLAEVSSTTFDAQLSVARRVAAENPHLYYEIQSLNDFGDLALSALELAVTRLRRSVRDEDESGFVQLMERGARALASRPR